MTQTTPLENGTKVLWGCLSNEDSDHDSFRTEAIIRGYTWLDTRLYYVLQTEDKLFVRPADWVTRVTSLAQYIGNYIELELEHRDLKTTFDINLIGRLGQLRYWIASAIDAYEGGAR